MNVHKNARLTVYGRERLVKQVLERVLTPAAASAAAGVSLRTVYKLLARYRKEGRAGLCDRISRPKRLRCALSVKQRQAIELLRRDRRPYREIAKSVRAPLSTVARYLRTLGLNRLEILDPKPPVQRYEHEHPGELVHLDIKRLARFRRPGHRVRGRTPETKREQRHQLGYVFLHVAVDDNSRYAFVEEHSDERGETAAGFLARALAHFREIGLEPAEAVTSDRAMTYRRSRAFQAELARAGARHILTPPYTPRWNGKAERFIQTLQNEWAYANTWPNSTDRARALSSFIRYYNRRRPHSSIGDRPPISRVHNLHGQDS